ncbi:MAG TPA: hypothetical protein VG244_05035 [Acidimicrobiales bacterium]|jgi:hypothetical protein|nr:hypothetical protein [Acidimicrobiales bacterium]
MSASTASGAGATPNADPSSVTDGTVTWTGNGTTNGLCNGTETDLGPIPNGEQAWLFILTSPGSDPFELTTNLGDATGTPQGNGSIHFVLFTPLDAILTSASAVTGTGTSILTVSGCQLGAPLISTTTSTTVDDASTGAPWSGDEAVGATAYDTAIVSPTTVGAAPLSGTVTYKLFSNGSCDGPGAAQTVTLNADGTVPHSPTTLPLAAGNYSYDAVYNGDSNYAASLVGSCEPFNVAQTTPTITTVVFDAATNAPWAGTEVAGSTAYDTSTLSGTATGLDPTGTVTYTFFPNGTCAAPGTAETVTIAGGVVPNSPTTLTLPAGHYSYDAVYSGDDNYSPSAVGACEPFSVVVSTSSSTTTGPGATATPTAAAPAASPVTPATAAPAAASSAGLAFTGADLSTLFAAGLLLIATGSALALGSRRRRRQA